MRTNLIIAACIILPIMGIAGLVASAGNPWFLILLLPAFIFLGG